MSVSNNTGQSLVVTTNSGEYYVIPTAALPQFRATPEQQERIDAMANAEVAGTFATLDAGEASTRPSFASEPETTALAWFQDL